MSDIDSVTEELLHFHDARYRNPIHNAKDLALAVTIEATDLPGNSLWKSPKQANPERFKEEPADIFAFLLLPAHK